MAFLIVASGVAVPVGATPAVAGLAPYQRPEGAPRGATNAQVVDTTRALHGVPAPRPPGLGFVEGQGGWYTPFTQPGMTGPYDLRGWHGQGSGAGARK